MKIRTKKEYMVILLAVLCLALTACSSDHKTETKERENHVVFTDALGREVSVQKNPESVAALIGSFADVWMLAGGELCASSDDAWDDFGLEMGDAVNLGGTKSPSLELLFSADPDFVIASASTAKNVEWLEVLENAGITVAYFDVSNFEDYLSMLDICTDITGRKDLYQQNGEALRAKIESVKREMDAAGIAQEQKTVLFLRASSGYIRAKNSEGSILGEMLSDLGCVNIADSDESLLENLSIESIIAKDPYRIFFVQVGDDTQAVLENIENMMEENPAWKELTAVRERRYYYMDKRLFNLKPNARRAEAYETLAEILQN